MSNQAWETKMFAAINRNRDCKLLADRLNAISARRKTKKFFINRRKTK